VGALFVAALLGAGASTGPAGAATPGPPAAATATAPATTAQDPPLLTGEGGSRPLAVVVDLSDSMNERDTDQVVKLDAAKNSLTQVLRGQPDTAEVGLWTFPGGGAGSCAAGGWVGGQGPAPRRDPGALIATVRTLSASGATPTAAALQGVADALRGRGPATVLLVSDGESNCDADPCATARDLTAQGLDITVQAMGFRISEKGREELQCIASATGGTYYDVQDATQLTDAVRRATVPLLEVDVSAPRSVPAGSTVEVTATVANRSLQDVADTSVGLSFTDAGSRSLFLAVVPPRYVLGRVPAGGSVERTWRISTTGAGTGTGAWVVSASSADGVVALPQTGTIDVTDQQLGLADAGPALKDLLAHGDVLVLGDSYSSGEGTGSYATLANPQQTLCHRSASAYGPELFGPLGSDMIACSGAVTADLLAPQAGREGLPAQLKQLRDSGVHPSAVLLTFGGNDIGFADIVKRCYFGRTAPLIGAPLPTGDDCVDDTAFTDSTTQRIGELEFSLENAYRNTWAYANSKEMIEARHGWVAPVIVMPYPQALPDYRRNTCDPGRLDAVARVVAGTTGVLSGGMTRVDVRWGFTTREIRWATALTADLDHQVESSVATVHREGLDVSYVSDAEGIALPNHTLCDELYYINPVPGPMAYVAGVGDMTNGTGNANEYVHPNVQGHRAMANALVAWSRNRVPPSPRAPELPLPPVAESSKPVATVRFSGTGSAEIHVSAGDAVTVRVDGMAPGTTVLVSIHSAPRTLAALPVSTDGSVDAVVHVPPDLPAGRHTLQISGSDAEGMTVQRSAPVRVTPARPRWFWPATGLAVAGLTTVVALAAHRARRRRRAPETPV